MSDPAIQSRVEAILADLETWHAPVFPRAVPFMIPASVVGAWLGQFLQRCFGWCGIRRSTWQYYERNCRCAEGWSICVRQLLPPVGPRFAAIKASPMLGLMWFATTYEDDMRR
jgi:hypothetical protein